jgi:hypothetical protein
MRRYIPSLSPAVALLAVLTASSAVGSSVHAATPRFHRDSLAVAESAKVTVSVKNYPGLVNPGPREWYHSVANVVVAKDGALVACYRLGDTHTATRTYIMVARSTDGGRTWSGHRAIAKADIWSEYGLWIAPQMSALSDGRLAILCDFGKRHTGQDWPMLTDWQKPSRGMSNWILWSDDHGKTWSEPRQTDPVGGEPSYIAEFADGTLAYTRTSSQKTDLLKNPPAPWNDIYYRNEIVFSRDRGRTWGEARWLADSPFHGDCEVGLAEIAPGRVLAATRIGLGNGRFGHPSRLAYSDDGGRTWPRIEPAPFYGQRPHLRRLQSGKMLVTYRNVWGTPGSRALVFDPSERIGFQPSSWIVEEDRCTLRADEMTVRTAEGQHGAVAFSFYPAQDDRSRVEIAATLRVASAQTNGVVIGAGCWVHFTPDRIFLGDRPAAGFDFDTRGWHDYRIVRENGEIAIEVDGVERLREKIGDIWAREVRIGNRTVAGRTVSGVGVHQSHVGNASESHWRRLAVQVRNAADYSIDWQWTPAQGYPDQFRRDRTVVLDYAYPADCGYSSWTQLPDGRIVILDYTNGGNLDSFSWSGADKGSAPFIRAYLVTEADLVRR